MVVQTIKGVILSKFLLFGKVMSHNVKKVIAKLTCAWIASWLEGAFTAIYMLSLIQENEKKQAFHQGYLLFSLKERYSLSL